jgi:predicted PurR-regulated permease PerM
MGITREDIIWIVAIAVLFFAAAHFMQIAVGTTIVAIVIGSLVRLAYAWYARRTWR